MFSKFDTNPQSDELTAADLYDAQAEWEAQQEAELSDFDPHRDFYAEMDDEAYEWTEEAIAWEEGMHLDNLYDGEPVMDLPNDLYMVFDDPDYWG
jgi:1-aminocyclopropane-1-carboxylate deaminase/D-cysteine desulfhydrase-like pyridoxal-dependent ACC family enzyme